VKEPPARRRRLCAGGLCGLALLLIGCGEREPATPPTSVVEHWTLAPSDPAAGKEYSPIHLPEARMGTEDGARKWTSPRGVLNCVPDGAVYFKQYEFRLGSKEDERTDAVAALRDAIRRIEPTGGYGGFMAHFDRKVRWADASDLLGTMLATRTSGRRLQIAVRGASPDTEYVLDLDLERMSRPPTERTLVRLTTTAAGGVAVGVAGRQQEFPHSHEFASRRFLAAANAAWHRVAEHLDGAALEAGITLSADGDVPWAHVVQLLDLLIERGCPDIASPDEGFSLRISRR
jgi:hypothetical protein